MRWDIAHTEGCRHASVTVLAVDGQGNLALQQRGERESRGRWDSSVAGHQDVGESDPLAAVRETQEELGVVVHPERLIRLGKPYGFRKVGTPSVTHDGHEGPTSYRYRTDKTNCERVSVFILRLSEEEKKQIVTGDQEAVQSVRWLPLSEAAREAEMDPERFASSFKQLLHPDVLGEVRRLIGSEEA